VKEKKGERNTLRQKRQVNEKGSKLYKRENRPRTFRRTRRQLRGKSAGHPRKSALGKKKSEADENGNTLVPLDDMRPGSGTNSNSKEKLTRAKKLR